MAKSPTSAILTDQGRLDPAKVIFVYTMFNHLGDFVVMGGLLRKFDQMQVVFESLIVHNGSPFVGRFNGSSPARRFYNIRNLQEIIGLLSRLRQARRQHYLVFGIPMASGSIQAFSLFWFLKKLGAISHIVDFNLVNADIITPPRRRYIFDRHLAQASALLKDSRLEANLDLPLPWEPPRTSPPVGRLRIGLHPWCARHHLPEFSWPDEKWTALSVWLLEESATEVVLFGRDPAFDALQQQLHESLSELKRRDFRAEPARDLDSLLNCLGSLDVIVTVNTSILHLAHALRKPVVVLCGPSLELWLPESPNVHVVADEDSPLPPSDQLAHDPLQPSLQKISLESVQFALKPVLEKIRQKKSGAGVP